MRRAAATAGSTLAWLDRCPCPPAQPAWRLPPSARRPTATDMPTRTNWTTPWVTRSAFQPPAAISSGGSSRITADALRVVREPLRWCLDLGTRAPPEDLLPSLRAAALGPCDLTWSPPAWLLAHQVAAPRRRAPRPRGPQGARGRGAPVPAADLIVVDEAHRFRHPETRRYDRLARAAPDRHLLLLSATPVVNRPADLVNLFPLFLP